MQSIKSCHLKPEGRFNIGTVRRNTLYSAWLPKKIKIKNKRNKKQINRKDGIIFWINCSLLFISSTEKKSVPSI